MYSISHFMYHLVSFKNKAYRWVFLSQNNLFLYVHSSWISQYDSNFNQQTSEKCKCTEKFSIHEQILEMKANKRRFKIVFTIKDEIFLLINCKSLLFLCENH